MEVYASQFSSREDCRTVRRIMGRVGDRWSMLVVVLLRGGPRRFNEAKRLIEGISHQMLVRTLRALERDGMITRTVDPSTLPPQVEYALTDLGRSLSGPVLELGYWVQRNLREIEAATRLFDQQQIEDHIDFSPRRALTMSELSA